MHAHLFRNKHYRKNEQLKLHWCNCCNTYTVVWTIKIQ